jgi:hypothetical protein
VMFEIDEADQVTQTLFLPFRLRLRPTSAEFLEHSDEFEGWPSADSTGQVSAPLAALCVLARTDEPAREVEIRLLSRAEAFTALIPHAYCFSLSNLAKKRRMMQHYLELAARTPTFAISIASGMHRLPQVIDTIEKTLPAFAAQRPVGHSAPRNG